MLVVQQCAQVPEEVCSPAVQGKVHGVVTKWVCQLRGQVQHAHENHGAEAVKDRAKHGRGDPHPVGPDRQVDGNHEVQEVEVLVRDREVHEILRLLPHGPVSQHAVRDLLRDVWRSTRLDEADTHQLARRVQNYQQPLLAVEAFQKRHLVASDQAHVNEHLPVLCLNLAPGLTEEQDVRDHQPAAENSVVKLACPPRVEAHNEGSVIDCPKHLPRKCPQCGVPCVALVGIKYLKEGRDRSDDLDVRPVHVKLLLPQVALREAEKNHQVQADEEPEVRARQDVGHHGVRELYGSEQWTRLGVVHRHCPCPHGAAEGG
mmetsp:Transcript_87471/g.247928  ORF Transcript_87471/g.247928 Transcript_87471/m.247928 type:complete len:316 (-) Transcript_87471:33-980(-)